MPKRLCQLRGVRKAGRKQHDALSQQCRFEGWRKRKSCWTITFGEKKSLLRVQCIWFDQFDRNLLNKRRTWSESKVQKWCVWWFFCVNKSGNTKKGPCVFSCEQLTSGPMCSVCVVRSVIWQSFIFRAALALSWTQNKHTHPWAVSKSQKKKSSTNKRKQQLCPSRFLPSQHFVPLVSVLC